MSDGPPNGQTLQSAPRFLRRVIDGAFDRVSLLEPRRPSRFEPTTIGIVDAVARRRDPLAVEEEPSGRAADVDDVDPRAHQRSPRADAPLRPAWSPRACEDREPHATAERPLETRDRQPEVAAGPHEKPTPRSSAKPADPPAPASVAVPVAIDARHQQSGRADREPPPLELGVPLAALLGRPVLPVLEPARTEKAQPREARRKRREPSADWKGVRPRLEPVQARTPATPAPEPVVNVTIGRIEVRVAPAQTPTRQRPEGAKPMGLDQYLRQRGGRR